MSTALIVILNLAFIAVFSMDPVFFRIFVEAYIAICFDKKRRIIKK